MPALAFATNGYFAIGYGMKNRGMAGVAVADPKDALAMTANLPGWPSSRSAPAASENSIPSSVRPPASEVSGSFMFAPRTTQICVAPACQTMITHAPGQFIGAQMWQYSLGISYGHKF